MTNSDKLLRKTLTANGVVSFLTGAIATVFSSVLADYMGINQIVLVIVGMGTLLFGIAIITDVRSQDLNIIQTRLTLFADVVWVAAAVVLTLGYPDAMTGAGNLLLALISIPVAVFAVLQALGVRRAEGRKRLITEIEIDAKPEDVWKVLSDIEAFDEWNPFIVEGSGQAVEGSRLRLSMGTSDRRQMTIRPTVTVAEPNKTLEWLGHLGPAGIFDGRHRFDLEVKSDRTAVTQSEEFGGILVPFLSKMLDGQTLAGFESMNAALKRRVEDSVLEGQV